jgi:H/ACA ribonucleoprotein complex non-core subunit NAF1
LWHFHPATYAKTQVFNTVIPYQNPIACGPPGRECTHSPAATFAWIKFTMDQSFNIPGLGELNNEKPATTSRIESDNPSPTPNVQADTTMTDGPRPGAHEGAETVQTIDTITDGKVAQDEQQAYQKTDTVMAGSEPTPIELSSGQRGIGVAMQHDEKMQDHGSVKPGSEADKETKKTSLETKEHPATTSTVEPHGRLGGEQDEPAPESPSVTHALEAALDGLLGPVSKSDDPEGGEKPAPEANTNTQAESTEAAPGENHGDVNPEWEVDSSPYESSSSDSSSDDDSGDDSDVDESKLLGVEETARLLMEADGGSDDEMDGTRAAKQAAGIRTKNELPDEPEPTPQINLSSEDAIEPLGIVQHIVEGTQAVIEALQVGTAVTVLDRGSVLCKEDRTVLGVIHDTIATVHKPMYVLRFRSEEEAKTAGLERGTQVWYSKSHANFVFPSQLRQEKGSDASNLHDEEVGPDEMEYSDDEQEQAHKREKKNRKRGGKGKLNRGDDRGSLPPSTMSDSNLNYGEDDDGTYHKLPRPSNFGMGLPPPPPPGLPALPGPNGGNRGGQYGGRRGDSRGRGRGRGFQGRGRGGGQGHNGRPPHSTQPHPQPQPPPQNSHQPPPPFPVIPTPAPGQWPFPVPPLPQFGSAAGSSTTPAGPAPTYPMQSWSPAQGNPFPFPPVPPPAWPAPQQQRPAQQTGYMPTAGGYSVPGQYASNNGPTAPAPAQNYQYPTYYSGQAQNNQQQRWG